uniref:Zgc:110366 n=1 Tax=Sinocyclocheilus grahami TaxID=75366 RepID=A0A672M3G9_SINGR
MVTVPSSCTALSCPTVLIILPWLFLFVLRHIDTAKCYGCEEALGKAVVDSGVPREELWLTNKLWPGDYLNLALRLIYLEVELHPFQQPLELVEYCRKENIVFEGYCPLAKGQVLTHPSIMELTEKYSHSESQICIRWSIQNGVVTIPTSTKPERVHENCQVSGFPLTAEDLDRISGLHTSQKLIHLTYPIWKG